MREKFFLSMKNFGISAKCVSLLGAMKYCFLDLETTGFDPAKDSIIEASFVIHDSDRTEITTFDKVIIPHNSELTPHITHITGITQQEIDQVGVPFQYVQEEIQEKLEGCVIVGHNIDFDIQFLIANGISIQDNPRIDTHELSRIILVQEQSYALEILAQKYGFSHRSAHRAMSDVEANIELYYFLLDRLASLPSVFFDAVRDVLESKTDWYARELFLATSGSSDISYSKPPLVSFENCVSVESFRDKLDSLNTESSLFIRQGFVQKSADYLLSCAHELVQRGERVLIVSPKLDFFPSVKKFPTPQVLFDPDRLSSFVDDRAVLNASEITFYLKCMYRHVLGLRGVDGFDLFFKERDFWSLVCVQDESGSVFQNIVTERESESILSLTPAAFFAFAHLSLFRDRVLLIDESEVFAEKLLFSCAEIFSLAQYLDHPDEQTSIATQFWVTDFCKTVLEPKLQRALSQYPEKIAFGSSDIYPKLAETVRKLGSDILFDQIGTLLETFDPKLTRWMHYAPESGNLSFGQWNIDDWKARKNMLHNFRKIFFYRHKPSQSNAFFRIFLSSESGIFVDEPSLSVFPSYEIPDDLISVKSPEFNHFTTQKLETLIRSEVSEDAFLVANFSSLETLKKVHHELFDLFDESQYCVCGEKVMGGDGKIIQKILDADHVVFLDQRILHPDLCRLPFQTLVFQKFPFPPPHPLLSEIEKMMKTPGISFWDVWTIPQVSANVSRRLSQYESVKRVIWLDPRENSSWGKEILRSVFPSF
jgi:DNA polymerase III epsilon subunit-like protein